MRLAILGALLLSGCLDATGVLDASAVVDLTPPSADLYGEDFSGAYHCAELNQCESGCDPHNLLCLTVCRNLATPSALTKDQAVQQCFNQSCPQANDLGAAICALDANGKRSAACTTCLANTQQANPSGCMPASAPECHACYTQAMNCQHD